MLRWIRGFFSKSANASRAQRRQSHHIATTPTQSAMPRRGSHFVEETQRGAVTRCRTRNRERAQSRAVAQDLARNIADTREGTSDVATSNMARSANSINTTALSTPTASAPAAHVQGNIIKRLQIELDRITMDPPFGCSAGLRGDNLRHWQATICGPPATAYEGGVFKLKIDFPEQYPYAPPSVRFITKIYHCNVDSRGYICIDILGQEWNPFLTMGAVLISLVSLLAECNANDPLERSIARKYRENREEHDRIARSWTAKYAN